MSVKNLNFGDLPANAQITMTVQEWQSLYRKTVNQEAKEAFCAGIANSVANVIKNPDFRMLFYNKISHEHREDFKVVTEFIADVIKRSKNET